MSAKDNLGLMDEATGSIIIPQNVTKIGNGAFRDVEGLRSIVIPGTVKEIGENAFSKNATLENVIIEEGVEKIGIQAFAQCTALQSIKIADSVSSIGKQCFNMCEKLVEINFPKSLKEISNEMLANCYSLKEVIIPEGIESISPSAFIYDKNLQRVSIPATVRNIGVQAFTGTIKLTNLEISENNKTYSFANSSLMSKDGKTLYFILANVKEVNIPQTVETIQSGSFESFTQKLTVNIPESVKVINSKFSGNVTRINVDENNLNFTSVDGNLYTKNMKEIIRYTQNQQSFTMPNEVVNIRECCFNGSSNLEDLKLSDNLEGIGGFNFSGTKIKELYLPAKVNNINHSISFFRQDVEITISEDNPNLKTLDGTIILSKDGKRLIALTKDLETYNIPNSVEIIEEYSIYSKKKIKEIILPNSVKEIQGRAFEVENLSRVEILSNIQSISGNAFSNCGSLREIIIDKKENEISGAPWGCPFGLRAVFWKK